MERRFPPLPQEIQREAIGRNFVVDHSLARKKIQRKIVLVTSGYACLVPILSASDLVVVTVPGGSENVLRHFAESKSDRASDQHPSGSSRAVLAQKISQRYPKSMAAGCGERSSYPPSQRLEK
jgi:hypothetical protein